MLDIGRGHAVGIPVALDLRRFALDGRGRLVLGTDPAAIDHELAILIDSDEDAGDGDLGGVVDNPATLEGLDLLFKLRKTIVDFARQFVDRMICVFEVGVFVAQRQEGRIFFRGQIIDFARDGSQPILMAVWKIEVSRDPLPAFGGQRLSDPLKLFGDEAIEKRHIVEPAVFLIVEQVTRQNRPAGRHIGVEASE
ncbi:MAG: hypothetical protein J0H25_06280, partial [Rhizobiales bacterium]|nr:hypothetical protein [Hyphomicrobiales bacterium]